MENECIVLADKHQNILEGLRGLLETVFGSVVMVADQPSLSEALNKLNPQVAIIDLPLLGHGNLNTICELHQRFPDVKVIILSDYDEPGIADDVISSGATGFVLKQYAGTDLFDAIQSVQEGKTFISPAVKNKQDSGKKERELK
jgi:DNA-binding NarL/FixJ family response regulator